MKIKPFKGLRPVRDMAGKVACRPYDVLDSEEARTEAEGNTYSFLNVVKPEITLPPDVDPHSPVVYEAGKANFLKLIDKGIFIQDESDCFYIYELTMDGNSQTGIVACAAVEDYLEGKIKKHELTRPDKEKDRKRHVQTCMLNAEPVFLTYRAVKRLDEIMETVKCNRPEYAFTANDGVNHRFWVVNDEYVINEIVSKFEAIPVTYIADGHHRTAAAALVGNDLKNENRNHTGNEEYNYFLAVHFPDNQLRILDYNRVVRDLNGHTDNKFIEAITGCFDINKSGKQPYKPRQLHEFGMYLGGNWYSLTARAESYDEYDPIGILDVTILSEQILKPVLGIHDLRTDRRIDFVGGIRGLMELERRVDSGKMAVAFALYPVPMAQLMAIADNDLIMPPKVTWFEPKLRSGLVVHSLGNTV